MSRFSGREQIIRLMDSEGRVVKAVEDSSPKWSAQRYLPSGGPPPTLERWEGKVTMRNEGFVGKKSEGY